MKRRLGQSCVAWAQRHLGAEVDTWRAGRVVMGQVCVECECGNLLECGALSRVLEGHRLSVVMLMVMGQTSVLWLNAIMLWSPGVTKGGVTLGLGGWWAPSRCAVCSAAGGLVCADSKQRLGGTGLDWYCSIQGCRCCQW